MPRGEQVARFHTLVMDLARSRRGVPAATLAARRDFPIRGVYRDLRAPRAASVDPLPTRARRTGAEVLVLAVV